MKFKFILLIVIFLSLTSSGCLEKQTYTGQIKTFTPNQCPICNDVSSVTITFDEGNLLIKDTKYIVRDRYLIESLYKSYKQNDTINIEFSTDLFGDNFISEIQIISKINRSNI